MPRYDRQTGFSLIELMVTIAVLAILLTIAVPSFAGLLRNNQVAAETNKLVSALNVARSEASKQGMPVTVCASNGASGCSGDADWTKGWVVFSDGSGAAGAIDPGVDGDVVLQVEGPAPAQLQVTMDVPFIRFNAGGERMNAPAGGPTFEMTFGVRHTACTGQNLRQVQVSRTGRITMTKVNCA